MAINPNVDFVAGAVLTASQQNRFGRGVVAFNPVTATDTWTTTEKVQITSSSFTAVANRYYRITYFEPKLYMNAGEDQVLLKVRLTNLAGAIQQGATGRVSGSFGQQQTTSFVKTFSAGATVLVATLAIGSGTGTAERSATSFGYLLVEDIGPA